MTNRFKSPSTLLSFVCIALSLLLPRFVFGQITTVTNDTSTPAPGTGHDYIKMLSDAVNPANGSLSIRIGIPTPPGRRLSLPFAFAYDSNGAHFGRSVSPGWGSLPANKTFLNSGGWTYSVPMLTQALGDLQAPGLHNTWQCFYYTDYVFYDPSGGRHALGLSVGQQAPGDIPCQYTGDPAYQPAAGDDFFRASTSMPFTEPPPPVSVADADGTVYQFNHPGYDPPPSGPVSSALPSFIEDRNGNKITVSDSQNGVFSFTDTLGRTLISSSGFGATGNTVTVSGLPAYSLTWRNDVSSNFSVSFAKVGGDPVCYGMQGDSETVSAIQAITLPNGQQYRFEYDSTTPGSTTYGLLSKIYYPSGGYVRYTWGPNPLSAFGVFGDNGAIPNPQGCGYQYDFPAVTDRYVSFDGTTEVLHQHFAYSTAWNSTLWTSKSTTVTTYDLLRGTNFQTTYAYSPMSPPPPPNEQTLFAAQIPVEQTVTYNDWNGNVLRSVNKSWADPFLMSCESTTQGGTTSRTDYAYSTGAQVTDKKEWDWGQQAACPTPYTTPTGTPLRETVTTPHGFGTTQAYLNGPSIFDRPSSVVTYGSGNKTAETDYTYDSGSLTPASGLPGHDDTNYNTGYVNRGNATTKTEWSNSGGASPQWTYAYDQTGQVVSMTDPCGNTPCSDMPGGATHTANYTYSNYNSYLSSITYPPTNGVTHSVSFTYNLADGQLASSTDQNNRTTNYYYGQNGELLDRLTSISYPDGGLTTYSYASTCGQPTSTSLALGGGASYAETTNLDGVCDATQTAITSDPSGADYTDTTYDGMGRVWKRSNPHRGGGSSTDGTTTYAYDALGRVTLTVPPDGTPQMNNVATAYWGNRTTVTDQTGRQRGYVNDALGRLIEADEPGTAQIAPTAINSEDPSASGALAQAAAESQTWLASQQAPGASTWEGNALPTQTSPQFQESGIYSATDLSSLPQTAIENIVIDPPAGVTPDGSAGPDGFPINYSPVALPGGNVFLNVFQNTQPLSQLSGHCFNLLNSVDSYRVDIFVRADVFYYMGSASLVNTGGGTATWTLSQTTFPGAVLAVLYPTSVPEPTSGSDFSAIPAGWIVHSNSGVGKKLSGYKAKLFVYSDTEYVQEDNVPIIVQDAHHARAGSSVIPVEGAGSLTVQVDYNDPASGYTSVYDSLETLAGLQGLPLSFDIPTNDPLYVPPPAFLSEAALQNRSFIYDDALAMIAYSAAGDYGSANDIIQQLNYRVDNPDYMATRLLENAEDGSTSNWSATNGTVTNVYDPNEPPYGGGQVLDFHANAPGATFTYVGSQLPDLSDTMISFEHKEPSGAGSDYIFDISVTSTSSPPKVTHVLVTSGSPTLPTYDSGSKTITIPIGLGTGAYGTTLENLQELISSLTGDNLTSITGFKVTLNFGSPGDTYFDNLSVGKLQPPSSLSFSYDVYNGNADQAYIRAGAMAWVVYAYCIYMQQSQDYTPALYVQKMINFLETLKSSANDLTNSLYYMGWGRYQDPGYQYVPGLQQSVSTEHQGDLYFAYELAAGVLPTAATQLLQRNQITEAQASSLNTTASTISSEADTIWSKLAASLYIPPSGGVPGHFAQGVTGTTLDTSLALDASGTWSAMLAHAAGDDAKAAQCLEFVYQNFYLTQQQILESNGNGSYNETYQQLTPFSGFKPYSDSPGGYSGSPATVWQEGTWGMVDALVQLQNVPSVQSYFNTVFGGTGTQGVDTFLTTLVNDQLTVWNATQNATVGQDSLLGYSLAARGLPWEFEVWPMLASTSWFWITATNPTTLFDPPGKPSGASRALIPQAHRQRLMARLQDHRLRGRRLADRKHGVLSRDHLKRLPAGKLGPDDPPTYYTYDALDNLLSVTQQGGTSDSTQWRTRTFVYDSLSRLTTASNPESGSVAYGYDANGNLTSKTDARRITTTYSNDALNRLTGKTYSNGDPAVTYAYDQGGTAANAVGRRSSMADAAGTESWTYDPLGRVASDQRTTNGVTKATAYSYYLDGSLNTLTYPSGRVMTYQVRGAELPLSVNDNATTYAANATYTPGGALVTLALGGSNINLNEAYSSRLQPSRIQASSASGTDLLDLAYDFGLGTADNGNVQAILNGRDNTRSQSFAYDALNRITLARTQATTGQNAWGQAFGYDPWGNLLTTALTQGAAPSFSVAANAQNQIVGYCYDASGNLLDPNACPSGNPHTYAYNAEGQMVSAVAGAYTYTYDGDGRRVKKSSGKLYWYGTKGEVLTESDLAGNITDEYVFFRSQRIARRDAAGNVDYYLSDQLGSSRVVTDSTGNMLDDCDFYPFGWDRCVASGSGNTYKFTGKERDSESSLDDFGARYYGSSLGRFMSVDPDNAGAEPSDPQTWNMYAYVRNNATTLTDATGLYTVACESDATACEKNQENFEKQRQKDLNSKDLEVQNAAKAWGNFGDTGVTVTFKSQSEVDADAGNSDPNVRVGAFVQPGIPSAGDPTPDRQAEFSTSLSGSDLRQAITHEGSHVEDMNAFFNSYDVTTGRYNGALNPTHFSTEFQAYGAGSLAKKYSMFPRGPKGYQKLEDWIYQHYPNADDILFPPSMYPQ